MLNKELLLASTARKASLTVKVHNKYSQLFTIRVYINDILRESVGVFRGKSRTFQLSEDIYIGDVVHIMPNQMIEVQTDQVSTVEGENYWIITGTNPVINAVY